MQEQPKTNLVTSTVTRPLLPHQETAVHRVSGGLRLLSWLGWLGLEEGPISKSASTSHASHTVSKRGT